MADEDLAIAPALETPASDEQEQIETPELETEQVEGEEAEPEEEEFEFNGKLVRGPKGLKDSVLMHKDYTQKRQADAETARAKTAELESREAQIAQQAEVTEAELDARVSLRTVNAEIERFKAFDWAAYQQARLVNPMEAEEAWNYKAHLQNQKAELDGTMAKAATERTEKAHQDLGKRVQETLAEAPKFIPNFKPEMVGPIADFLERDMGLPEQAIKSNWGPHLLKLGYFAKLGQQLSKKAAAKPVADPTPAPPLTTVRPANPPPATGLSDRLSPEEWTRRRNAQLAKKRA